MTQEEANKMILDMWSKEKLAEGWHREHIKYNELQQRIDDAIEYINGYKDMVGLTGGLVLIY